MYQSLLSFDHHLFQFINQGMANPVFDAFMPVIRNRLTWIPVYILLGCYTILKFRKEAWPYIVFIALAFIISDTLTYHVLKPFFHRSRPCFDLALHARLVLGNCGGQWSFPSSHAANHMAISLSIILSGIFRQKWMNVLVFVWAISVGFAQIYVGVHYPIDIITGFVWGGFLAFLLYLGFRRIQKKIKGG